MINLEITPLVCAETRTAILEAIRVLTKIWEKTSKSYDDDGFAIPEFEDDDIPALTLALQSITKNEQKLKLFLEYFKRKFINSENQSEEKIKNLISFSILLALLIDELNTGESKYLASMLSQIRKDAEYCCPYIKACIVDNNPKSREQNKNKFVTIKTKIVNQAWLNIRMTIYAFLLKKSIDNPI